ncbi:MAG: hypothetical protein E7595_05695 [Ruminococcaceae bacterium]|nr:hypothetical protein [Oscillospiraceae bacterium]
MKRFLLIALSAIMLLSLCACGSDEYVTADGMKAAGRAAGNDAVYYNFSYPEEWSIIRNDGVIEIQYDCDESATKATHANIAVLCFTLKDSEQTAKQYWAQYEEEVQGIYTDYKLLDTKEYSEEGKLLDDAPAIKVKYEGKLNGNAYTCEQILCCRYGTVYIITLTVPSDCADKVADTMTVIKDSFEFAD